jgi:predicted DNA-binding antitoxin AbrB/MazE fold protein
MKTIRAVFENGQFRPLEPVELPDRCVVEFEPKPISEIAPTKRKSPAKDAIYAILSQRFESGETDVAARHDEHQP